MSRAYKQQLVDEADDLSSGALNATGVEKLSGADLEQLRLAALNGSNPAVDAAGTKTVGTNLKFAILATISADGANTVTVDSVNSLYVGQVIDILDTDGATVHANDRTITAINLVTKVVTYNGADAGAAIAAGDFVIPSTGRPSNAAFTGADLERYAGDQ
jgi:hypothetical protein